MRVLSRTHIYSLLYVRDMHHNLKQSLLLHSLNVVNISLVSQKLDFLTWCLRSTPWYKTKRLVTSKLFNATLHFLDPYSVSSKRKRTQFRGLFGVMRCTTKLFPNYNITAHISKYHDEAPAVVINLNKMSLFLTVLVSSRRKQHS